MEIALHENIFCKSLSSNSRTYIPACIFLLSTAVKGNVSILNVRPFLRFLVNDLLDFDGVDIELSETSRHSI